jgi:hypothetical protein
MSFKVRRQYPEFEIDEYTPEQELSFEEAIDELKSFDWDSEIKKSQDLVEEHANSSIILKNINGDELAVYKAIDSRFAFEYRTKTVIPKSYSVLVPNFGTLVEQIKTFHSSDRPHFVKKFQTFQIYKSSFLIDVIGLFASRKKNRITREVQKREFRYQVNPIKVLYMLGWCFIMFLMPSVLWLSVGKKPFAWTPYLIMQALMIAIALPGFITAHNHWKKNGSWVLLFQARENKFILVTENGKDVYDKKDFVKRIRTEVRSNAPWNSFEYTTLIRSDGRQLHFSSILISNIEMSKFFASIEETAESKAIPIIKDKVFSKIK